MAYFTVEVKCAISGAATGQHAAFTAGDLLFDWQGFEIPRGGAKLVGVTALVRPKGDADPTPNNFGFDLIFGKVGTTLGSANAVAFVGTPTNDIIGSVNIAQSNFIGPNSAVATSCISVASVSDLSVNISPDDTALNTGTNVGYDKFYVAGVANGDIDFRTIVRLHDGSGNMDVSVAGTTIATDGTGMDIREHFIVGDELIAHDDAVIGTVASLTDATDLELTSNFGAGTLADDDYVYAKHPITLKLHFEK
tara:strand:- start:30 stop:782 length:753 start_codon:yes stop_codon:yes gene_type:complete